MGKSGENGRWSVQSSVERSVNAECAARVAAQVDAASIGAGRIRVTANLWRNQSTERLGGRLAEELHATSFNVNAAGRGFRALRANPTAVDGVGSAAADILISGSRSPVPGVQVKYHGTPASTTFHAASKKYSGLQIVVPSDQVEQVRGLAGRRGQDCLGVRDYRGLSTNASGRISVDGVQGDSFSRSQALEAARNPEVVAKSLVRSQTVAAVRRGAVTGAAIGGGISLVSNAVKVARGEKDLGSAVADTARDVAFGAVGGAAMSGITVAGQSVLVKSGMSALAKGNAPVAIAITSIEVGKDVFRYARGEMTGAELAVRGGGHAATGVGTWGGAELGTMIGTAIAPGPGTVLGAIVGGIVGGIAGGLAPGLAGKLLAA